MKRTVLVILGLATAPLFAGEKPSFQDALDALRSLRSVTEAGITYQEYSRRLLDAKVSIDRYFLSAPDEPVAFQKAVRLSLGGYQLASFFWSRRFARDRDFQAEWPNKTAAASVLCGGEFVASDRPLGECPAMKPWAEEIQSAAKLYPAKLGTGPAMRVNIISDIVEQHPAILWTWAAAQLAEAERLAADPK
jgi:hypothetical protein